MADVYLKIGVLIYGGWKEVTISRGIEQVAGSFEITLTDKWDDQIERRPVSPGSPCTVMIENDVVITGYIDAVNPSYDSESHSVSVSGRDATGDLVDCSAGLDKTEWKDRSLLQIASDICAPFGIKVRADTDLGADFAKIDVDQGETAFDLIDRLCRNRAVLAVSDGLGGLLLTRASSIWQGNLIYGENILGAHGSFSHKERFSIYHVKGTGAGSPFVSVAATASSKAIATDPNINRYRPLIIIAEENGDAAKFKDRALFASAVRAGRGRSATYTVPGWRTGGESGELWRPNRMVTVDDPLLGLAGDFLVSSVQFTKGSGGSKTELTIMPQSAFQRFATSEEAAGLGW